MQPIFHLVKSFTDPNLPAGSARFNIQPINGKLQVGGAVVIFDMGGNVIKSLTSGKELKGP